MKISIKKNTDIPAVLRNFDGDEYVIDLDRPEIDYQPGDLICSVAPWLSSGISATLSIAIRATGEIVSRGWVYSGDANDYLHTREIAERDPHRPFIEPFAPTDAQIDTVNGIFSGRIKVFGLKLAVGASVQRICPIDVAREAELVGHKIYLA